MDEVESHDDAPESTIAPWQGGGPQQAARDAPASLDLERVEADLAGVEAALRRLDDGSYWTDEVTGEPIPDDVLAANPVARRAG